MYFYLILIILKIKHINKFIYRLKYLMIVVVVLVMAPSCKKDPIAIHENKTIPGNHIPLYKGVSSIVVKNYINTMYIDLIGREPVAEELDSAFNYLVNNNLSDEAKSKIVDDMLSLPDYHTRLFEIISLHMINGLDSLEIDQQYQEILAVIPMQTDSVLVHYYELEASRMEKLLSAKNDYQYDIIDINEYYKRFINNLFYDDINMGSENFVLATFENLYKRFPTVSELEQGISMVDNQPASLFLQDGSSKGDFINIVVNYTEFYEGLIRETYLTFLQREPTSVEMDTEVLTFKTDKNYQILQKKVLITEEYAGF